MNYRGLCAMGDCGAPFDEAPVPHRDRDTKQVVLLCVRCSEYVERTGDRRYERIALPPQQEGDQP